MRISDWSSDVCSSDLHATPVLAGDDDGCRDVLHHHEAAAAHVAAIGLQKEGLGVLSGGEADAVVDDAPVAAVGGVPHRIAPLRLAELQTVARQVSAHDDAGAATHAPGDTTCRPN